MNSVLVTGCGLTLNVSKSKYKTFYYVIDSTLIFQVLCINVLN